MVCVIYERYVMVPDSMPRSVRVNFHYLLQPETLVLTAMFDMSSDKLVSSICGTTYFKPCNFSVTCLLCLNYPDPCLCLYYFLTIKMFSCLTVLHTLSTNFHSSKTLQCTLYSLCKPDHSKPLGVVYWILVQAHINHIPL